MKAINKIKSVLSVKLLLYIPVFCVLVFFSACKDQLTEQPQNFYSTEDFFKNTDRLRMAVNGVYEVFSNQATYGQYWMVYDTDTDISFVNGSGTGHVARDLGHYNIYVEHSWLQESWQLYYQGIDRVNTILENMAKVEIKDTADQKVFNELIAETSSLRAMCFFPSCSFSYENWRFRSVISPLILKSCLLTVINPLWMRESLMVSLKTCSNICPLRTIS